MRKDNFRILGLNIICAAVLMPLAGSAWGALNKCTGTDGKVTYTEQPCEQNQSKTTVTIAAPPPADGPRSGTGKNRDLAPGQVARCEQARRALEFGKREAAQERNRAKADLLASMKQNIASLEQLIQEQCN